MIILEKLKLTKMKTYTITEKRLLDWYFDDGDESRELKEDLAELVIKKLRKKGKAKITVKDIFKQANTGAIRCYFLEEFENNLDQDVNDSEIRDFEKGHYTIKLIK